MAGKSMKEVIESGKLKRFLDPRLSKAFGHRFREHLLAVFNERIVSPTEVGRDVGMEVPDFYKHITVLEELGCIEEVNLTRAYKKPHPGKHERFFRAKATIMLDALDWQRVPASVRSDTTASYLQSIWGEVTKALRVGGFAKDGTHLTWLPGTFDKRGWTEAMALLDEALARLMEIQKRSAERVATTGEAGIPATIAMLGFGTAP